MDTDGQERTFEEPLPGAKQRSGHGDLIKAARQRCRCYLTTNHEVPLNATDPSVEPRRDYLRITCRVPNGTPPSLRRA